MKKYFDYNHSTVEFNDVVDSALELARATYEGTKGADYMDKNRIVLENLGKLCVQGTRYEADFEANGLETFKRPMVGKNSNVRENFDAVIAQIVSAIVPEIVSDAFEEYIAEVKQVGFGETARFIVESNDLFKVNSKAEGVRKGVDQPMFDREITLTAHPIEISTSWDFYALAAGVFDMGNWAVKVGRSFAGYIFIKAIAGMTAATTEFGSAYQASGIAPASWNLLNERVSAANGGMNVIAIGTPTALGNCTQTGNFQVAIGEKMNEVGYLDQYLNVPLIAIKNVLVPGTTNGAATLALPTNKIYMIPVGGDKPVKILFEGNELSIFTDTEKCSDRRYAFTIEMRVGVSAVVGAKCGTITI